MAARPRRATATAAKAPMTVASTPAPFAWMETLCRPCDPRPIVQRLHRLDVEGEPGVFVTNGLVMLVLRQRSDLAPAPVSDVERIYRHLPSTPGPHRLNLSAFKRWLGEPPPPARCPRCGHEHWDSAVPHAPRPGVPAVPPSALEREPFVRVYGADFERALLAIALEHLDAEDVYVTPTKPFERTALRFWAASWRLAVMPLNRAADDGATPVWAPEGQG